MHPYKDQLAGDLILMLQDREKMNIPHEGQPVECIIGEDDFGQLIRLKYRVVNF